MNSLCLCLSPTDSSMLNFDFLFKFLHIMRLCRFENDKNILEIQCEFPIFWVRETRFCMKDAFEVEITIDSNLIDLHGPRRGFNHAEFRKKPVILHLTRLRCFAEEKNCRNEVQIVLCRVLKISDGTHFLGLRIARVENLIA